MCDSAVIQKGLAATVTTRVPHGAKAESVIGNSILKVVMVAVMMCNVRASQASWEDSVFELKESLRR